MCVFYYFINIYNNEYVNKGNTHTIPRIEYSPHRQFLVCVTKYTVPYFMKMYNKPLDRRLHIPLSRSLHHSTCIEATI